MGWISAGDWLNSSSSEFTTNTSPVSYIVNLTAII